MHIPLVSAYLCCNCEAVGSNSKACEACTGTALLTLSTVLSRSTRNTPAGLYRAVHELESVLRAN